MSVGCRSLSYTVTRTRSVAKYSLLETLNPIDAVVQVSSYDASKKLLAKLTANDKTLSTYEVSTRVAVDRRRHAFRADTTSCTTSRRRRTR